MESGLRNEMDSCGECQDLKQKGLLGCCQYHLDKQFDSSGDRQ